MIIGVLLVNVVITAVPEEKFSVIYYLDSDKRLENIPKTVILGKNNTFSLDFGANTSLNIFTFSSRFIFILQLIGIYN